MKLTIMLKVQSYPTPLMKKEEDNKDGQQNQQSTPTCYTSLSARDEVKLVLTFD